MDESVSERDERVAAYKAELAQLLAQRPRNYRTKARKLTAAIVAAEKAET